MKKFTNYIIFEEQEKIYSDALIISNDNKILLLRRSDNSIPYKGYWGFPGGKIKKSEDPKNAIIREIKEETGIELTYNEQIKMKNVDTVHHDKKKTVSPSDTIYWLVYLESMPEIKLSNEHTSYKWVDDNLLMAKGMKIIPGVYEIIQKYYNEYYS